MVIAITGSISTGKSTVSKYIAKKYPVIDADLLARDILKIDSSAYLQVVKEFGKDILLENREIDRKKLGTIIFSDKNRREALNSITHKEIRKEYQKKVEEYIQKGYKLIFYDIPLLFEVKLEKEFEKIIVVYIPEELQLERLMKRDSISKEIAIKKIQSQISIEDKKRGANYIIDNSKGLKNTYFQIDNLLKELELITNYSSI